MCALMHTAKHWPFTIVGEKKKLGERERRKRDYDAILALHIKNERETNQE